jgi:hypothetical protein
VAEEFEKSKLSGNENLGYKKIIHCTNTRKLKY